MYKLLLPLISFFFISGCTFEVNDTTPPEINLLGDTDISYDINDDNKNELLNYYLLPGTNPGASYSATDNITTTITHSPIIMTAASGVEINISDTDAINDLFKTENTYVITYAVEDEAGNKTEKTRTIIIKDITPPVLDLSKLHPFQSNSSNYPFPHDAYSLLVPASTPTNIVRVPTDLFFDGVTVKDVWTQASGSTPESLSPYNEDTTKTITFFPLPHASSTENDLVFEEIGNYIATYTAIDKNGNITEKTRNIKVAFDTTPPIILTSNIYHQRLTNVGTAAAPQVDPEVQEVFLLSVLNDDLIVQENFLPYSLIKTNPQLLHFDKDSDLYIDNTTASNLTSPTSAEGFQLPIVASDISGNTTPIYFRTIVFTDNTGPVLQSFPTSPLYLQLDANTTSATAVKQAILSLSNDVIFIDETITNVATFVESVRDADGFELDTLIYADLSSNNNVYTITYDANDGFQNSSTDIEIRQRNLIVIDTTPPVISFPNFTNPSQLFLSFPTSSLPPSFDSIKTDLINAGNLSLTDNSTNSFDDITLTSSIVSTSNSICATPEQPLDLNCPGEHIITLTAEDKSHNSATSPQLKMYIYNSADKDLFDEIVENIDGVHSFTDKIGSLETLISDIELSTTNTDFNPTTPFPTQNQFDLTDLTNFNVDSTAVSLDYTVTSSNNISVITDSVTQDTTAIFSKPSPHHPELQTENTTHFITSNLDMIISVGTYVSKISLPIKISPFINESASNVLALKLFPLYEPNFLSNDPTDFGIQSQFNLEEEANDLSNSLFADGNNFNLNNSQGLYKYQPAAFQTNNFIQQDGVSVKQIYNLYSTTPLNESEPTDKITSLIDETGALHFDIEEKIALHFKNIILTNDHLRDALDNLVGLFSNELRPSEFKIILLPNDKTMHDDLDEGPFLYSSNTELDSYTESPPTITDQNLFLCSTEHFERTLRGYTPFEILCIIKSTNNTEEYYVLDPSAPSPTPGTLGLYDDTTVQIFLTVETTTTTDAGPETTSEDTWCNLTDKTQAQISVDINDCLDPASLATSTPLSIYSGPSTAYTKISDDSPLTNFFDEINVSLAFTPGTITSSYFKESMELSTGVLLTKFINRDLIPTITPNILSHSSILIKDGDNVGGGSIGISYNPDINNYTLPTQNGLSFYSSGFTHYDTSDTDNIVIGSKPGNMSAFDKVISGIIQPTIVSVYDMEINNKVYLFDLNTQDPTHNNQLVIKVPLESLTNANNEEYLLVEKRLNSGNDNHTTISGDNTMLILSNTSDEANWEDNDTGFIVWHVETENTSQPSPQPSAQVKSETNTNQLIGDNFTLQPTVLPSVPSTNTNSNEETGIIIKVIGTGLDKKIKICNVSTGALDITDPLYDADCTRVTDI